MEKNISQEFITLLELQKEFDSEWVLLENPKTTAALEIKSGKVLWHSKDRDELYRKALELKPKHSAIVFIGKLPEEVAIVL